LNTRFRNIYPVSTECKHGANKYKELYREYNQSVKQASMIPTSLDIIPVLAVQGSNKHTLIVLAEEDFLNIMKQSADFKNGKED